MSQTQLLIDAVDTLERARVGYLMTGSFASSLQGEPRSTHDVDLVVEVEPRMVSALAEAFGAPRYYFDQDAALDALRHRSMFQLLDTSTGDKVDFWALTDGDFDASRFARRVSVQAFGRSMCVSSPEDTILQKLKWAQASGGSERHVRDATGVYEFQSPDLDETYLSLWAGALGVEKLLATVRERATSDDERVE
ncbi:MAG: hypothetical protein U1E26_02490 [Coriobacteriia bacterium]|nr:hypothetical protein [Coriobacteriia bacterium]